MTSGPDIAPPVTGTRGVRRARSIVVSTTAVSILVGLLGGAIWAVLAPPEQFAVVEPGIGAALTGESLHRFDALALMVCISLVVGIVVPVSFWMWKAARGPILLLGLLVGSVAGSATMLGTGVWGAGLLYPRPDDAAAGSVVSVAPGIASPLILVVQPLVTGLVVALLAAMNPHDNLRFTPADELPWVDAPRGDDEPVNSDRA